MATIPVPTTAMNRARSWGLRTRRSRIISGSEGDDGHHERQEGAHRGALFVQGTDHRHDAGGVGVQRDADGDSDKDAEGAAGSGVGGEEVGGDPAVDDGTQADADEEVRPDLAEDGGDFLDAHLDALVHGEDPLRRESVSGHRAWSEDEGLDPALGIDAADDPAGHDRDEQSCADVDGGDLPAEEAEQHADGDLVRHRTGDEEAHRDAGGRRRRRSR